MRYYYFNPFNKQYYFPEGFEQYDELVNFYHAYTLKGKLLWFLWMKLKFIREFFTDDKPNITVPLDRIQSLFPENYIFAFNRGTKGPEQKTTIIGCSQEKGGHIFIKYANTLEVNNNVINEANVLREISLPFVPEFLGLQVLNNEVFLKTKYLYGSPYKQTTINNNVIDIIMEISRLNVECCSKNQDNLMEMFGHGDFCPWNIMDDQGKLTVFDWEMAGYYPVGYDLFTYIFQTSFLLKPGKNIDEIMSENRNYVRIFFSHFKNLNWKLYLVEFARIKFHRESAKNNSDLVSCYAKLIDYAQAL